MPMKRYWTPIEKTVKSVKGCEHDQLNDDLTAPHVPTTEMIQGAQRMPKCNLWINKFQRACVENTGSPLTLSTDGLNCTLWYIRIRKHGIYYGACTALRYKPFLSNVRNKNVSSQFERDAVRYSKGLKWLQISSQKLHLFKGIASCIILIIYYPITIQLSSNYYPIIIQFFKV